MEINVKEGQEILKTESPEVILNRMEENVFGVSLNTDQFIQDAQSLTQGGYLKVPEVTDLFRSLGADKSIWSAVLGKIEEKATSLYDLVGSEEFEAGCSGVVQYLSLAKDLGMDQLKEVKGALEVVSGIVETLGGQGILGKYRALERDIKQVEPEAQPGGQPENSTDLMDQKLADQFFKEIKQLVSRGMPMDEAYEKVVGRYLEQ